MSQLSDLRGKLNAKRDEAAAIFAKYPDVGDLPAEEASSLKSLNSEMRDLQVKAESLAELEGISASVTDSARTSNVIVGPEAATNTAGGPTAIKTVRQLMHDNGFAKLGVNRDRGSRRFSLPVDVIEPYKTLVTLATYPAQNQRLSDVLDLAREQRTVADLFVQGRTNSTVIEYLELTTFTNAAAAVAEGGTKPESALATTLRTVTVRKYAHNIPVTDETLADEPQMDTIIRNILIAGLREKEEDALLNGTGVAPQIIGLLNVAGIQTQAKGTDSVPAAIYKAITKIRNTGFTEPTAIVMNPTDYQTIRLLQDANGAFLLGPMTAGGEPPVWGFDVRLTSRIAAGTALVGAFKPWGVIYRREEISVEASTEHGTFFAENKVLIQAEERFALATLRPTAFCTVTGL